MEPSLASPHPPRWRLFFSVVLGALLVRAVHLLALRNQEFFQVLGLDAEFYDRWARALIAGESPEPGPYFQGPLYPYFLSLVYRLPGADVLAAQVAQLLLGALSAGLAALIAEELFGRRIAWLCGLIASCYGYAIFLETQLVAAPLIVFLVTAALWLCLASHRKFWLLALAGALSGLAAVGSGLVLAAVGIGGLGFLLQARRKAFSPVLAFAAGLLLAVAPVTAHNLRAGQFVLLSTNGGINYFIGNHAGASGAYEAIEGVEFFQSGVPHDGGSVDEASRRAGRTLSASDASNYWLREGLRWQFAQPAQALGLLGRKLLYVWSDYEIPQIENFDWAKRESTLLRVSPFRAGLLIPLGLLGLWLAAREWPRSRSAALAIVGYWLALAAFFVTARFRVVALPALFAFSAYALVEIVRSLHSPAKRRGFAGLLACALLMLLAFRVEPAGVRASSQQLLAYSRGVTSMQRGDFATAAREFTLAARQNPAHVATWANLGFCQERLGQIEPAIASYTASLKLQPANPRVLEPLSQLLLQAGHFEAAQTRLLELTAVDPANWLAWASLGDLAMQRGDHAAMRQHWQRVLEGSSDPDLRALARERLSQP